MLLISLLSTLLANKDKFSLKRDRTSSYFDNLLKRLNTLLHFFLTFPSELLLNGKCNLFSVSLFFTVNTYLR